MKISKRILYLLLAFAVIAFDQFFQIINYSALKPLYDSISKDPNFMGVAVSAIEFAIFTGLFILFFKHNNALDDFYKNRRKVSLKWYQLFFIALGFSGITVLWLYVVEHYLITIPAIKQSFDFFNKAMDLGAGGGSFVTTILYGSVFAALMEEMLFRGIVHNSIKLGTNSRIVAIILTGVIFGAWHGILVQAIYAAIGGILFSYVYEKTGRLSYTIAIHFLNNFMGTIAEEIYKMYPQFTGSFELVTVLFVPVLCYFLYRLHKKSLVSIEDISAA